MASRDKVDNFVELVLTRSNEGRLDWTETPDGDVYSAVLADGENIIKVFNYSEFPEDGLPSLAIFTSSNKMVVDVRGSLDDDSRTERLQRIYELARGHATGEDRVLDEVVLSLQKLDT